MNLITDRLSISIGVVLKKLSLNLYTSLQKKSVATVKVGEFVKKINKWEGGVIRWPAPSYL
jgi:hypothetical protein